MLAALLFSGQAQRVHAAPAGIKVAVDCDPQAAGIQSTCSVTSGTTSFTVDIVMVNQDSASATLAGFNFDLLTDQTKFDPPLVSGSDLDANPDFRISPTGTWTCAYPGPANDVDPSTAVADSSLMCFDAATGVLVPAGSTLILATVRYNIVTHSPSTANIDLSAVTVANDELLELGSCNSVGIVPADCTGAVVSFVCPGDTDCDGIADTTDNCVAVYNPDQLNTDRNFIDLHAFGKTFDDLTAANSDQVGDACDTDKDNDGLSNGDELNLGPGGSAHALCPGATAPTDPLLADTDGDRVLDGAECALGTDAAFAGSVPPASPAGDTDHDGLTDAFELTIGTDPNKVDTDGDLINDGVEVMYYNTNPLSTNTDGDACGDGKEIGSVNNDTAVNVIDLQIISKATGSAPGPPYVTDFDLNKDGQINVLDLQLDSKLASSVCP
jgi:hypothetical protein